jgi:hypothetical protein
MSVSKIVYWGLAVALMAFVYGALVSDVQSQPPAAEEAAEPAPPAGQTYTGVKRCASCHFKQFMSWKKSKHSTDSFKVLPEKHQADKECLPCHTTGFGQPTGFKDVESSPNLAGTTCEACHGPGSEHEKVCEKFKNKKKLDPDEDKAARDSIYKIVPGNVCIRCHAEQAHKTTPRPAKE